MDNNPTNYHSDRIIMSDGTFTLILMVAFAIITIILATAPGAHRWRDRADRAAERAVPGQGIQQNQAVTPSVAAPPATTGSVDGSAASDRAQRPAMPAAPAR